MNIPRIDTLVTKSTVVKNNRQMRIPTDLNKPVLQKFNTSSDCNQKTSLNIII